MCMKSTPEGCELRNELMETKATVASLDTRLTKVEHDVGKMRLESQDGFKALTASLSNLAHDFGSRMNSMDARLVERGYWGLFLVAQDFRVRTPTSPPGAKPSRRFSAGRTTRSRRCSNSASRSRFSRRGRYRDRRSGND